MEKWPKDGSEVSFREITRPIKEAILFAYNINRKNKNQTIPWHGLDTGQEEQVRCFAPKERLEEKNLRYSEDEQGRDALDEILGIAAQLGIEQGRRAFKNSTKYKLMQLKCNNCIKKGNKTLFQCFWCLRCCSTLSIIDRLRLSIALKTVILHKKCKFIEGNRCSIYTRRPKFCKNYECGVVYES